MKELFEILSADCDVKDLHCIAIVGNEESYDTLRIGDYHDIGESLYFALCENKKLFKVVSDAVKLASEVVGR